MFDFKRKLVLLGVPVVIALGALGAGTGIASATSSTPSAGFIATATTESSAESPETGAEIVEANEPALPGGGWSDQGNAQADTQQQGTH